MTQQVEKTPDSAALLIRFREEIATAYCALQTHVPDIDLTRLRTELGINDVIDALLAWRDSALPFIQKAFAGDSPQTVEVAAQIDAHVHSMIARFGHLYTEITNRRLQEQQRRTDLMLNAVQMASASLELDQVLGRVAETMVAAVGVSHCGIYLPDAGAKVLVPHAAVGQLVEARLDVFRSRHLDPAVDSLVRDVLQRKVPVACHGTEMDSLLSRETIETLGVRSVLAVPIKIGERVLGIAMLSNLDDNRALTDEETDLAEGIANAVALAIENARLYEETHRRLTETQSLQAVTSALLQKLSLGEVLTIVCHEAQRLTGAVGAGVFLLEDSSWLRVASSTGAVRPSLDRLPVEESLTGSVILHGEPLLVNDPDSEGLGREDRWTAHLESLLVAPLHRRGAIIGALGVVNRPGGFTPDDLRSVTLLAHHAGIAVESARLYQQEEQLAVLEERQRIARDLHDSVTQGLYSVVLYAETAVRWLQAGDQSTAAEHLREVRKISQESLREMRLLIFELRSPVLEKVGLAAALQARLEVVEERVGIQAELRVEGAERLPHVIQEELYRIAQEALNNVLKHAWARHVTVLVRFADETALLEISDDGLGFDQAAVQEMGGLGLRGMAERAQRIGGKLTVESLPGKGTRVRVEVDTREDRP